ncbi:hypothetical protein [Streptomyces sp. NPDC006971]|uniref:VOC family protein n=1 Tax=Streptomyces sp. NPDC006971 TaxID=3154784 RepID=UPI0034062FC8
MGSAGGSLLTGPLDVFDEGRFAMAADPSGTVFSLWQARAVAGFERLNAPGALGWVELVTHEAEPAPAFSPGVLGRAVNTASEKYPRWSLAGEDFGGPVVVDDAFAAYRSADWPPYVGVADVTRRRPPPRERAVSCWCRDRQGLPGRSVVRCFPKLSALFEQGRPH